jgi:hypothetical protein
MSPSGDPLRVAGKPFPVRSGKTRAILHQYGLGYKRDVWRIREDLSTSSSRWSRKIHPDLVDTAVVQDRLVLFAKARSR